MQSTPATFVSMTLAEVTAFIANKRVLGFGTVLTVPNQGLDAPEIFFGVGQQLPLTPGFNGSELARIIALENHQITIDEVDGLQTALDGKAALVHTHDMDEVNGLTDALSLLASIEYVDDGLALKADVTYVDSEIDTVEATLATKAPLASPVFTGTPEGPTAAVHTSTEQLATTEFVVEELATLPVLPTITGGSAGLQPQVKADESGYELVSPAILKQNAASSLGGLTLQNLNTTGYGSSLKFNLGYNGGYDAARIDAENDSTGGQLRFYTTDTGVVSRVRLTIGADGKLSFSNGSTFSDPWAFMPIGVPIPVQSDLSASLIPANDLAKGYSYIDLTAGLTGAGGYNNGKLTSESISGSAPLNLATAVISLATSSLVGKTVRLINTEKRFLRAGLAGTYNYDQMQQLTGDLTEIHTNFSGIKSGVFSNTASGSASNRAAGANSNMNLAFNSALSPNARTGNETYPKNIELKYFMRIL